MPRATPHSHTSTAGRDLYYQIQYRLDRAQGLLRIIAVLVFTIGLLLLSICAGELWTYRRRVVPVLLTRRPVGRILCRRQDQESQRGRRCARRRVRGARRRARRQLDRR